MIEGRIDLVEGPRIQVWISGRRDRVAIDALLDTGFDGDLCLPIAVAVPLGLELRYVAQSELADGSVVEDELVFAGLADWDGEQVPVEIILTRSRDALIGTGLLQGCDVRLNFVTGQIAIDVVSPTRPGAI